MGTDLKAAETGQEDMPQPKPRKKHQARPSDDREEQNLDDGWPDVTLSRSHAAKSPPRSPLRREQAVPPLNLTSLHEHTDGEGILL